MAETQKAASDAAPTPPQSGGGRKNEGKTQYLLFAYDVDGVIRLADWHDNPEDAIESLSSTMRQEYDAANGDQRLMAELAIVKLTDCHRMFGGPVLRTPPKAEAMRNWKVCIACHEGKPPEDFEASAIEQVCNDCAITMQWE